MTLKNPWPGSPPLPPLGEPYGRRPRGQRDFHNLKLGLVIVFIVGGVLYLRGRSQPTVVRTLAAPRPYQPVAVPAASPQTAAPRVPLQLVAASTFPGQQGSDVIAGADGRATVGGLAVRTGSWARSTNFSSPVICGEVTMTNVSAGPLDYDAILQWRLQSPSGDARMTTYGGGGELMGGTVIAGGTAAGRLCFADPGLRGRYVALYSSAMAGAGARGAWLIDG